MKYILSILTSFILLISFDVELSTSAKKSMSYNSEKTLINPCPDSLDSPHNVSSDLIKELLNSTGETENEKIEAGINHLDFDNLELLSSPTDDSACIQLNNFKNEWLENDNKEETYYKIDSYYFMVRWNNKKNLGFQPVFVFDSQFDLLGIWSM